MATPQSSAGKAADGAQPPPSFRSTLFRVIGVQVVALILLWLLQARYHV